MLQFSVSAICRLYLHALVSSLCFLGKYTVRPWFRTRMYYAADVNSGYVHVIVIRWSLVAAEGWTHSPTFKPQQRYVFNWESFTYWVISHLD